MDENENKHLKLTLCNFIKNDIGIYRMSIIKISKMLVEMTGGLPKRIGTLLFAHEEGKIRFLETPTELFSWMHRKVEIKWKAGSDPDGLCFCSRGEFYSDLCFNNNVQEYEAVEVLPHSPQFPNHYYTWSPPADYDKPDQKYFNQLLDFFDNAENQSDKILIKALFMIPCWGGEFGTRPAFYIAADEPGCGKSTLTDVVGLLYNGMVELEPSSKAGKDLVTRLLSNEGLMRRIVRLDNLKQSFSNADIEALITQRYISGRQLYVGEGRRPNYLVYLLTSNGFKLSADMAQRCFIIRLGKPKFHADWRDKVMRFVDSKRDYILADILALLNRPPIAICNADRWATFVSQVLSKCANSESISQLLDLTNQRREIFDAQKQEVREVWNAILRKYSDFNVNGGFISSYDLADILDKEVTGIWNSVTTSSRLKEHIEAGRLPRLRHRRTAEANGFEILKPEDIREYKTGMMREVIEKFRKLQNIPEEELQTSICEND